MGNRGFFCNLHQDHLTALRENTLAKPSATVDYKICNPQECNAGKCLAVEACQHKVLEQEAPGESPFAFRMCTACGACVTACPLQAIKLF